MVSSGGVGPLIGGWLSEEVPDRAIIGSDKVMLRRYRRVEEEY